MLEVPSKRPRRIPPKRIEHAEAEEKKSTARLSETGDERKSGKEIKVGSNKQVGELLLIWDARRSNHE